MAVAMARHANTPKRFMHLAMKFAVRLLNRLFRRMPDGSTDVPLWRYKGARVPLNLDRFHPWGCSVHVHVEKKYRTRFEAKSYPCVFFGYDDAASAAILGKLPGLSIVHSAHGRYNDDEFPCRSMGARSWDHTHTYDTSCSNPADVWFGPPPREEPQDGPMMPCPMGAPSSYPQHQPHSLPAEPVATHSPTFSPSESTEGVRPQPQDGKGLRRSNRAWCPSTKALQHIATEGVAAVNDMLASEKDFVPLTQSTTPFFNQT